MPAPLTPKAKSTPKRAVIKFIANAYTMKFIHLASLIEIPHRKNHILPKEIQKNCSNLSKIWI